MESIQYAFSICHWWKPVMLLGSSECRQKLNYAPVLKNTDVYLSLYLLYSIVFDCKSLHDFALAEAFRFSLQNRYEWSAVWHSEWREIMNYVSSEGGFVELTGVVAVLITLHLFLFLAEFIFFIQHESVSLGFSLLFLPLYNLTFIFICQPLFIWTSKFPICQKSQ